MRVQPDDRPLFWQIKAELNWNRLPDEQIGLDESCVLDERGGFVFVGRGFEVDSDACHVLADIEREMAPEIARRTVWTLGLSQRSWLRLPEIGMNGPSLRARQRA
jgi:hypothetical protein